MATLAENAAAVKAAQVAIDAAIVAKGGTTTGGLTNAASAIEALPSGGNLTRIAETVKTMDGIERENPDEAELANAITEITRQPNRRGDVQTDEPEWTADEGKTAFVVKVDETSGLDFIVGCLWFKSGSASATIDWGDGSTSMVTQSGVVRERHFYAASGYYLIQISDDIKSFYPHLNVVNGSTFSSINGRLPQGYWSLQQFDDTRNFAKANNDNIDKVYRVVQWGASITDAYSTYNGCSGLTGAIPAWGALIKDAYSTYSGCSGLTGAIPAWGASITDARRTYYGCSGLTGAIPAWGASITNAYATYYGCSGLTGAIPAWGASITSASATYYGCSGLTGAIPAWGASITNASATYYGCSGLTGAIPAWGASITNASATYYGCSGLTGAIPAWGASITSAYSTYSGCSGLTGAIPAWGASITNAYATYYGCSGLTGAIPAWGASITNAYSTYSGCSGLTGAIPAWGASITSAQQTYYGCSGLTGAIPAWGASITNAQETYRWCFGLTSIWDEAASDEDIMPSRITSKTNCVNNTSETLRAFFLTAWGGSRAS